MSSRQGRDAVGPARCRGSQDHACSLPEGHAAGHRTRPKCASSPRSRGRGADVSRAPDDAVGKHVPDDVFRNLLFLRIYSSSLLFPLSPSASSSSSSISPRRSKTWAYVFCSDFHFRFALAQLAWQHRPSIYVCTCSMDRLSMRSQIAFDSRGTSVRAPPPALCNVAGLRADEFCFAGIRPVVSHSCRSPLPLPPRPCGPTLSPRPLLSARVRLSVINLRRVS